VLHCALQAVLTNEADNSVTWQRGSNRTCVVDKEMQPISFAFH
jgi:hypothetical protein